MRNLLIKYTILLFSLLSIQFLIIQITLPKYSIDLSNSNFPFSGFFLFLTLICVFILFQKALLKTNNFSILKLVFFSYLSCLFAEAIFQIMRLICFHNYDFKESLYYISIGVIGVPIMGAILAFFTSFQIKTKKTGFLILYIFIFLVSVSGLTKLFPNLFSF